jgi:hypothetical protein
VTFAASAFPACGDRKGPHEDTAVLWRHDHSLRVTATIAGWAVFHKFEHYWKGEPAEANVKRIDVVKKDDGWVAESGGKAVARAPVKSEAVRATAEVAKAAPWAHSDRAHQDPTTIESVPVRAESTWAAVRAVCQGVQVERETESEISRWRFVRALPLVLEDPSRIPIGALTIASALPREESILTQMSAEGKTILHDGLRRALLPEFEHVVRDL